MKTIFLSLLLLCSLSTFAQVSGKVTDEKGQPLPGAVIKIYHTVKPVKVTITDNEGHFDYNGTADYLITTYTGFLPDTVKTLKPGMLIRLRPDTKTLKEVSIVSRQPIIRQETDRTVISVNAQVKKLADNGLEILNLAPGITVSDNEDAILMSGKSEVQIMINDKVVKMTPRDLAKMLKAMPSGSIKQVEFLSNPPAKYEVNGNTGIINIKTNGVVKGLTGNVDYSTSQGTNNWTDLSGLLNYGAGKLAISGYGAWHRGGYLTQNTKVRQLNPGTLDQQTSSLDKWSDPVFRIAADYAISHNSTFGGIVEREASTNTGSYDTYSQQGANSYQTSSRNPNVRHWNTYNLNYRYSDTLGTDMSIDLDRADFYKNGNITLLTTGQPRLNYQTATGIRISTLKTDYSHAWKNKLKLEAGLKIAGVQTDNTQDANVFHYHENIRAVYTSLSRSNAHWGWQLGLRAEQTEAKGEAGSLVKPDTSYLNLLPSAYLTYTPTGKHHFRLSLSRRIRRPDYSDLQPFTYVLDPLNQQTGNPGLRVQRNDQAELTYTFDDRITLVSSYNHSTDYFSTVYRQSGDILVESPANTGTMNTLNFDLNYPLKIAKWWNMLNKANIGNDHFSGELFQGRLDQGKWRYQFSTSQRITLPGKYQLQLSGRYTSASQNLIYSQQSTANASASIGRKFFNDQASLRIGISDIFKTQRNYTSVNFGSLQYTDLGTFESRRVSLNFSWRFGNNKVRQTRERNRGDEDEKGRSGS
ncbi:outer membrane receptor protein involved in Fe transport [Mucilaginibacter gracilis]|uniref:Outer membrane receptor protein involved in Fe transport n=1 Tax=Mucilaginibacter gracilis TaxID=423350 RepID=A0A495IZL3_9SPHI|nr:outer membrane beta-barrel family protein [Mucilaginibacter gracilis]RKR82127.1 outer membrane receptor protein involved in Fe transport [Mucilaginibacter gracilis]